MQTAESKTLSRGRSHSLTGVGPCVESRAGEHLLLRELTHRINNELASTISFVTLTAAQSTSHEVKLALAGVIEHVHNVARTYRALQMPASDDWIDAAKYLRELCRSISRAKLQHKGVELVFKESPLQLDASRCWRLGMIVSELITNAARHAFGAGDGKIEVVLLSSKAAVECTVTDNGSGPSNERRGQGLRIIRSLVDSLNGNIDQCFGARGTTAVLSFPFVQIRHIDVESLRLNLSEAKHE